MFLCSSSCRRLCSVKSLCCSSSSISRLYKVNITVIIQISDPCSIYSSFYQNSQNFKKIWSYFLVTGSRHSPSVPRVPFHDQVEVLSSFLLVLLRTFHGLACISCDSPGYVAGLLLDAWSSSLLSLSTFFSLPPDAAQLDADDLTVLLQVDELVPLQKIDSIIPGE